MKAEGGLGGDGLVGTLHSTVTGPEPKSRQPGPRPVLTSLTEVTEVTEGFALEHFLNRLSAHRKEPT